MTLSLLYVVILVSTLHHVASRTGELGGAEQRGRCRNPRHAHCLLNYHQMSLWCDQTNFTSIPNPLLLHTTGVRYYAPPEKSDSLHINHSCLATIDAGNLSKFKFLVTLDLSYNFITRLTSFTFLNSTKLERLLITNNHVTRIEADAFAGLFKLRFLHVGGNALRNINRKTFQTLRELRQLKINDNQVEVLPRGVFVNLKNLEELDLSGNKLQVFSPHHLKGVTQLKALRLQGNMLKQFIHEIFLASPVLQELDLRNNSIQCLEGNVFTGQNLIGLDLRGNPMETPKSSWFRQEGAGIRKLKKSERVLDMSGVWVCDCKAYHYSAFLKNLDPINLSLMDLECNAPKALLGKRMSDLTWQEIITYNNCSNPEEKSDCRLAVRPSNITTTSTTKISVSSSPNTSPANDMEHQPPSSAFFWRNEFTYILAALIILAAVCVASCAYAKRKTRLSENDDESKDIASLSSSNEKNSSISLSMGAPHSRSDTSGLLLSGTRVLSFNVQQRGNKCNGSTQSTSVPSFTQDCVPKTSRPPASQTKTNADLIPGFTNLSSTPTSILHHSLTSQEPAFVTSRSFDGNRTSLSQDCVIRATQINPEQPVVAAIVPVLPLQHGTYPEYGATRP